MMRRFPRFVLGPSGLVPLQLPFREALAIYVQRLRLTGTLLLCVLTLIQLGACIARLSITPAATLGSAATGQTWLVEFFLLGLTGIALGVHRLMKQPPLLVKVGIVSAVVLIGVAVTYAGVSAIQGDPQDGGNSAINSLVFGALIDNSTLLSIVFDLPPLILMALLMLGLTVLGVATGIYVRRKGPITLGRVLLATALAWSSNYLVLELTSYSTHPGITALLSFQNGFFWYSMLGGHRGTRKNDT